jgi:hypothetical protein
MRDQLRLRYSMTDGPELRCPHCGDWLPITVEFWEVHRNEWHMCRACKRERSRLYALLRGRDAEYRTARADYSRRYRAWLKATAPGYLEAYDRERRKRNREAQRGRDARSKENAA